MAKRIDVAALTPVVGTLYPPPFDEPCHECLDFLGSLAWRHHDRVGGRDNDEVLDPDRSKQPCLGTQITVTGAIGNHIAGKRIAVGVLLAAGASLGFGSAHGMREVRRKCLAAVPRCGDRRLLDIDVLSIRVFRAEDQRA